MLPGPAQQRLERAAIAQLRRDPFRPPFGGPAPRADRREAICHQPGDEVRKAIDSGSVAAASRDDGSSHTIEVMTIRLAHFFWRVLQRSRRWNAARAPGNRLRIAAAEAGALCAPQKWGVDRGVSMAKVAPRSKDTLARNR